MTLSQLRRKTGRSCEGQTAQTLIGKIDGNAEPRLLNEEALHFIHGPYVLAYVGRMDTLPVWPNTIQVLIDVGDAIFPQALLPFRSRQFIFQRRFHSGSASADAIQSCRLTSLLLEIHLPQQILDPLVDRRLR